MKQKLIAMLSRTRNSAHLIRALVGAYVAYSCGRVTVAYFTPAEEEVSLPLMLGSAVVALCGVAITALALWALAKGYSVEYGGKSPWTMPEGEEEEAEEAQQLPEESQAEAEKAAKESEAAEPAEESGKDNNQ